MSMREEQRQLHQLEGSISVNPESLLLLEESSPLSRVQQQQNNAQSSIIGLSMSINLYGTKLSLVSGTYNLLDRQKLFSKGYYSDILVVFKQSSKNPPIYPYQEIALASKKTNIQQLNFPINIIDSQVEPYKQILLVCLDHYRREDYQEEKRENYLMQKVMGQIFMHAKEKNTRSLTIPYLWSIYFDKGSNMLLKVIKRYLITDLSLGKPVPFDKINILIKDSEIYKSMNTIFMEEMFKLDE